MDSNLRKTLENNLQIIKPMIDEIKSFPNDTNEMTPIIKYLKNLPPIHYTINDSTKDIKVRNAPLDTIEHSSLRTSIDNLYYDKNRLTINNNTNLTNLNLYFLYNNEDNKTQPEKQDADDNKKQTIVNETNKTTINNLLFLVQITHI